MQFSRNRRILLAQDIILVCLIPLLCFLTLGSVQIGKWNTGDMLTFDPTATEIGEECLDEFYVSFTNADGDELGETISFSPLGIWKAVGEGAISLLEGLIGGTVAIDDLGKMPAHTFDDCAELLFMLHLIVNTFVSTLYQGLLYAALFGITAAVPVVCGIQALCALIKMLMALRDPRKRHRNVVLCFRKAALPLFTVLALTFMLPDVKLSSVWFYGMGLYLLCVIWNFIASRVKRNTGNEKEFLNFIQIFSGIGVVLAIGSLVALEMSRIPAYLYDRIRYADGLEIILDCLEGNFDIAKLLMLLFIAVFLVGIGLVVRYLYYGLVRFACIMEGTRHKKTEKEGMIVLTVFSLLTLASSYFLFEASGRLELVVEKSEMIAFYVMLGLLALVLIMEIVQRILCYLNRLDREYRNDLLCGRTDDRMYSVEAVIAETAEEAPATEAPVEEAPVEEAPVEETPVEETPFEEAPVEEAPVEEAPVEETPVEETPVEEAPVEEAPVEEAPVEETPIEEAPVEETPVEESPAEESDS